MTNSCYIQPDIDFISEVKKNCGVSLTACMQCGTCSVVCELSPGNKPFPRKEMIWTAWGLKEKLYGNPDIWLCHQCGDCSTYCPRDVRPSEVLSSLRYRSYLHYAKPKFLGKMLSNPKLLPVVIAIPVIIILGILYLAGTTKIPEGDVNYSKFFPHLYLNTSFLLLVILVFAGILSGLKTFWQDMKKNMPGVKKKSVFKSLITALKDSLTHKDFKSCKAQKFRYNAHMLILFGFITLLMVTVVAIFSVILDIYPLKLWHPAKIAGNLASVMLIAGCLIIIYQRIVNKDVLGKSNYFDWFFIISLLLLTLSGVLTEIARFQNWHSAYYIYFFHLLLVWIIIIYMPYTKFGHFIYRTAALTYSHHIGRSTNNFKIPTSKSKVPK